MASFERASPYLFTADSTTRSGTRRHPLDRRDAAQAEQERVGGGTVARPKKSLIWIHTGEDPDAYAARELARRLQREHGDLAVLITTDADRRRRDDPKDIIAQFSPNSTQSTIRRFLEYWTPMLGIWTEPAMRPNLAAEAAEFGIPLYMLDADTSDVGTPTWRPWRRSQGQLLAPFELIVTGDPIRAEALRKLGAHAGRTKTLGYLQEGTAPPSCNQGERDLFAAELSGRATWLAARLGPREIDPILEAHRRILERAHRMLLFLVPEDEKDGPYLKKKIEAEGFTVAIRSEGEEPTRDTQIYVADTEGEIGLWYRLAPVSYLGQSLEPSGGIDPYPAAALGSAVLHGPHVTTYLGAYDRLAAAGATRLIRNAEDLVAELDALLAPDVVAMRAHAAWKVCSAGAQVTDYAIDLILTALDELELR